jgi:AmpD protein
MPSAFVKWHYNERPNDKVSLVVIHNISLPPKQFGGDCVEQFFTNQLDFGAHPYFQSSTNAERLCNTLLQISP